MLVVVTVTLETSDDTVELLVSRVITKLVLVEVTSDTIVVVDADVTVALDRSDLTACCEGLTPQHRHAEA